MKKKLWIVLIAIITLAIYLTSCFYTPADPKKTALGERYDSNEIAIYPMGEDDMLPGRPYMASNQDRLAELFDKYSKAASEAEFVVHENTAIAIAEAVMFDLYPDDDYGVIYLPRYFRPLYYKAENCWEVWVHKNARNTTLSINEQKSAEVIFVYVDVNSGAVRAIIPAEEFSVHNPANSDNRIVA